jgi:hypothetical protein
MARNLINKVILTRLTKTSVLVGLTVCFNGYLSTNCLANNNAKASVQTSVDTKAYTVRRGDSLWKIAKRHRPSKKISTANMLLAIQKLNKYTLNGRSDLYLGMNLKLPTTSVGVKEILHPTEQAPKPLVPSPKETASKTSKNLANTNNTNPMPVGVNNTNNINNKAKPKKIEFKTQILATPKVDKIDKIKVQDNKSQVDAWMLLSAFFMLTTAFLYWRFRQSQQPSSASGTAALRLGIRSKNNQNYDNTAPAQVSVTTKSEPKLNIRVDATNQVEGMPLSNSDKLSNEPELLDELSRIKTRVNAAPHSIDLRLDLLRKLVQLDDQDGFKKAVDELTPLLTEEHQTVWSDIRSMYFGKWAYDT